MGNPGLGTESIDLAQALVEELLRTALSVQGAFVALLEDLPEDAFPGEDKSAVLERVLTDLRDAARLAGQGEVLL